MSFITNEDIIEFENLKQPTIGTDFILDINHKITSIRRTNLKRKSNDLLSDEQLGTEVGIVKLDFSKVINIFSNCAVPLSGIIEYYQDRFNIEFERVDDNKRVTTTCILNPLTTLNDSELLNTSPLNKVWRFSSSSDVNIVVDSLVNELRKIEQFSLGVLDALTWSLNEVMDNVLQHSGVGHGFVMGQIHRKNKHIAFCVFDNGVGIFNSLKNSIHKPNDPIEALKIAVQESVTRDKSIGQGNGMYGLDQIVKFNKGRLTIISNTALYKFENESEILLSNIPSVSEDNGGTMVDFQLDYNNQVSISEALIFKGKPHTNYVNYYLENLENEEGDLYYNLKEWNDGVGTRPSGKKLRNEILNNFRETKKRFVIDFANINVISSSFADELLGKLVVELGFFGFNNLVKLRNMNELIQQLVQRSVTQRMSEAMNKAD
jgi:STAS-like domain of unknown function (DUF4325)